MPPNRWELAKQREDDERERRRREVFPSWLTPWRAILGFGILTAICAAIGIGLYIHEAPLRDPQLPRVSATVTKHFSGKNNPMRVHYRLPDGRVYDEMVNWRGRGQPAVGQDVTLAYVPSEPGRFRIVGHYSPGSTRIFILGGCLAVTGLVMSQAVRIYRRRHPREPVQSLSA